MADEMLFTRDSIEQALLALAEQLATHGHDVQTIVVVGGSYLALHDLRDATRDIDTVTRFDNALSNAIAEVASALELPRR